LAAAVVAVGAPFVIAGLRHPARNGAT